MMNGSTSNPVAQTTITREGESQERERLIDATWGEGRERDKKRDERDKGSRWTMGFGSGPPICAWAVIFSVRAQKKEAELMDITINTFYTKG